jgi:hypothetical protein
MPADKDVAVPLRVGLAGALGGATNAWLCHAQIPVFVGVHFKWYVVPAGAIHGAVLAFGAFGVALFLLKQTPLVRIAAAPVVAWTTGYLAWIPLNSPAFNEPWLKSLRWPFQETWMTAVFAPFLNFGLVALLYYLFVSFLLARTSSFGRHLLCATAAGVLGSLWWWIYWDYWYLSLLHGVVWGACVGTAAWYSLRLNSGARQWP